MATTVEVTAFGTTQTITVHLKEYSSPRNLAIKTTDEVGHPWCSVSINPQFKLPEGVVAVYEDDMSVNDTRDAMIAAGMLKPYLEDGAPVIIPMGYKSARLYTVHID